MAIRARWLPALLLANSTWTPAVVSAQGATAHVTQAAVAPAAASAAVAPVAPIAATAAVAPAAAIAAATPAAAVTDSASVAQAAPAKPKQFLYVLRLTPSYHQESAWKDADNAAVSRHFDRLAQGVKAGQVILAGRTDEPPDQTFGIVIFEAESVEAARRYMETDPAVEAGVMTATLHPYSVALIRR
jgi:uncharacterized protein YciI